MTMKKTLFLLLSGIALAMSASAQKDTTRVIDNKGTIKWVISSSAAVITKADSTLLYVTPKQLADSNFIKLASNGLTKNGQTVELGGALNRVTTIQTTASNFLQITGLQRGSNSADSVMVVDPSTGQLKFISASSLFNALAFENGLTKTGNTVQLGGSLVKPTTLTTDATNTLKIAGLQSGSLSSDSLVVSATDGTLKRVTAEALLQSGGQYFTTTAGQTAFSVTNMPPTPTKVWVYRNGAKLTPAVDFTTAAGQVTLTSAVGSLVAAGDSIEVQWVK
jgi:hypothetical protein